jgi:hypothetical protein
LPQGPRHPRTHSLEVALRILFSQMLTYQQYPSPTASSSSSPHNFHCVFLPPSTGVGNLEWLSSSLFLSSFSAIPFFLSNSVRHRPRRLVVVLLLFPQIFSESVAQKTPSSFVLIPSPTQTRLPSTASCRILLSRHQLSSASDISHLSAFTLLRILSQYFVDFFRVSQRFLSFDSRKSFIISATSRKLRSILLLCQFEFADFFSHFSYPVRTTFTARLCQIAVFCT